MSASQWFTLPASWRAASAANAHSVLLETSRFDAANYRSCLFLHPVEVLTARSLAEIPDLFLHVEKALAGGLQVAGYAGYECGYHFQSLEEIAPGSSGWPLAWFGLYREALIFDHRTGDIQGDASDLGEDAQPELRSLFAEGSIELSISEEEYGKKIHRIQEYISAGDTYQVNFTSPLKAKVEATVEEIFATLLRQQPVAYGALVNLGDSYILSFSPELFFKTGHGEITVKPMKGTMPRGLDCTEDAEAAVRLQNDEKNRAEHVMIVDLLRNDLGRICAMGSVAVKEIFSIERYQTLFQMTSTITGTLLPGLRSYDIFKSLFPCGSITGAPKIRTMEVIRELEDEPRGVYTGAIGFMSPGGEAAFNVAIRTLELQGRVARMGVGGGIVADSQASAEYRECLLKGRFLTQANPEFQLIETMLWDGKFSLLEMHLDRMQASASYFQFAFDRAAIAAAITSKAEEFIPAEHYRVRVLLNRLGTVAMTAAALPVRGSKITARFSEERTYSGNVFLRHKTTHRELYDRAYREAVADGFDDVLFLNEKGEVTEGAISNVFVRRDGKLLTPPLSSGVLPGVLRRQLLESDARVQECVLTIQDMQTAEEIFLGNSVRGLLRVDSLRLDGRESIMRAMKDE